MDDTMYSVTCNGIYNVVMNLHLYPNPHGSVCASEAADGQPDLGLTPDQAQTERNSVAEVPECTSRDDRVHTLLSVFWALRFAYAVDSPTL